MADLPPKRPFSIPLLSMAHVAPDGGSAAASAGYSALASDPPVASVAGIRVRTAGAAGTGGPLGEADSHIDFGFPFVKEFDRGHVEMRPGAPSLDLRTLQTPQSCGARLGSFLGIMATAATGIGIFYLINKTTLVQKGELALVQSFTGDCRALGPGLHLLNTFACKVKKAPLTIDSIALGTLQIVRIPPDRVGLATVNAAPLVLLPGVHLVNDPAFKFEGSEPVTRPHISLGSLHLIVVPAGQVGRCTVDSTAHILERGRHHINNPKFSFLGFSSSTEEHISVGSKHRVVVPAGKVGLCWDNGTPQILEPGVTYNIDSPTWTYVGSVPATQQVIRHGSLKVVTVREGAVGVSYNDGVLQILEPGLHKLQKPSHAFAGFLSTGQQTLSISSITSMSSDNVGLVFDAAITVQVQDPRKAITALGNTMSAESATSMAARRGGGSEASDSEPVFRSDAIWSAVIDKTKLALSIIIGNSRLNGDESRVLPGRGGASVRAGAAAMDRSATSVGAPAATAPAGDDPAPEAPSGGTGSFRQHVLDVFTHEYTAHLAEECGVAVVAMSIEDVRISDVTLAQAMARGAVARTDLLKARIELEVKRTEATAAQAAAVLAAEGQAEATRILAEAEASRIRRINAELSAVAPVTQQRELVLAAAEVLKGSASNLVFASSPGDLAAMMAGGAGLSRLIGGMGAPAGSAAAGGGSRS